VQRLGNPATRNEHEFITLTRHFEKVDEASSAESRIVRDWEHFLRWEISGGNTPDGALQLWNFYIEHEDQSPFPFSWLPDGTFEGLSMPKPRELNRTHGIRSTLALPDSACVVPAAEAETMIRGRGSGGLSNRVGVEMGWTDQLMGSDDEQADPVGPAPLAADDGIDGEPLDGIDGGDCESVAPGSALDGDGYQTLESVPPASCVLPFGLPRPNPLRLAGTPPSPAPSRSGASPRQWQLPKAPPPRRSLPWTAEASAVGAVGAPPPSGPPPPLALAPAVAVTVPATPTVRIRLHSKMPGIAPAVPTTAPSEPAVPTSSSRKRARSGGPKTLRPLSEYLTQVPSFPETVDDLPSMFSFRDVLRDACDAAYEQLYKVNINININILIY